jgi:hypothetical protein
MDANRVATVTARLITIARVLQPVNGKFFRIIDEAAGIIQILQARVANTADSDRLQSALDAAPVREEREGKCWCVEGDRCEIRTADNASYWVRRMLSLGHPGGDTYPPEDAEWHEWEEESEFCCNCGAHLGADGIARRWRERGGK